MTYGEQRTAADATPSPSAGDLLEDLARDECLHLLASQRVGRLAVNRPDDGPLVVPVNFALSDDEILFRTGPGTKLNLARGATVSFQVDGIDPARHGGWSVLVVGHAFDATLWDIDRHGLVAWAGGARDNWIRIVISRVTGRRISVVGSPSPPDGIYL